MTFLYRYICLSWLLAALVLSIDVFAQRQPSVDSNAVAVQFVDRLLSEGDYTAAVLGMPKDTLPQRCKLIS